MIETAIDSYGDPILDLKVWTSQLLPGRRSLGSAMMWIQIMTQLARASNHCREDYYCSGVLGVSPSQFVWQPCLLTALTQKVL